MVSSKIYQIKATIIGTAPAVWRRFLVRPEVTLAALHEVLQTVFGWDGGHLHEFTIGRERYQVPYPERDEVGDPVHDEGAVTLGSVVTKVKSKFIYLYDFGDGWEHALRLEKKLPEEPDGHYPVCVAGGRHCPPDDCGGVWGYEDMLAAIADESHPDHDDMVEWIGDDFDPESFSLEAVNEVLARH